MILQELPEEIVSSWLRSLNSRETLRDYITFTKAILGENRAGFLSVASENPWKAEQRLIGWVADNRDRLSPGTVQNYLSGVRSMLEYAGISIRWRRIKGACKQRRHSSDRATLVEEIRKLYFEYAVLRLKLAILIMAQGGCRLGAFDSMIFSALN